MPLTWSCSPEWKGRKDQELLQTGGRNICLESWYSSMAVGLWAALFVSWPRGAICSWTFCECFRDSEIKLARGKHLYWGRHQQLCLWGWPPMNGEFTRKRFGPPSDQRLVVWVWAKEKDEACLLSGWRIVSVKRPTSPGVSLLQVKKSAPTTPASNMWLLPRGRYYHATFTSLPWLGWGHCSASLFHCHCCFPLWPRHGCHFPPLASPWLSLPPLASPWSSLPALASLRLLLWSLSLVAL